MSFRIFVGNLSYEVSDSDIEQAFSPFGQLSFFRVIQDRETGKSRGFGFVEFQNPEEGSKALRELDGSELRGRPLRLREAEERGDNRGGPRGHRPDRGAARGPRPEGRGDDRPHRRGPREDAAPPPREDMDEDRARAQRRREKEPPRRREETERRSQPNSGGRPPERSKGGAKNRFGGYDDDDEDDDIDLFGKYHEDDDVEVDFDNLDGVEFDSGDDDDEPNGLQIPFPRDDDK
ncbi:MAG: hypothetical protein CSA62_10620 [Planctomycetota bacterium]|nr:MAG: hypothetical protein CSA62_10620 [Planctomycetota bacterium]